MNSLKKILSDHLRTAFEAAGIDQAFAAVLDSQRPDLGQFQCNGPLAAAKKSGRNPREVAEAVTGRLDTESLFSRVEIAGPGFINLTLQDEFLAAHVEKMAHDTRLGVPAFDRPRRLVIDFGGPNVAKPMHVGHLRSSIIGDALQRMARFLGDRTTSDIHLGDWGTQMGMLIHELRKERPELPYFRGGPGPFPDESPVTIDDLESLYPRASARCKEDALEMEAARVETAALQAGEPGLRALWRHFVAVSRKELEADFSALGITFDLWMGESDYHTAIPDMLDRLEKSGHASRSEGATVMFLERPDDKKPMPPLLLVKSGGGYLYATTDLATIDQRVRDFQPDVILYVVDKRQSLHFEQVFRAAEMSSLAGQARLEHVDFGTVNGTDGKPFKTRAGGVMKLKDLISMVSGKALERIEQAGLAGELGSAERERIARMVGIAALKFGDLINHRSSDYVFDLDKFTSFEGKTGPYLQYAAVRIKSILRKASERGFAPGPIRPSASGGERALALQLARFPDALLAAYDRRAPNALCESLYDLAQTFSRFYQDCHILREPDESTRGSWLGLSRFALRQFETGLNLLGIEVPDQM